MSHTAAGLPGRNIELKARDPDPERSLAACRRVGATDQGVLEQRDTYFAAATGRLKLREHAAGRAELIAYRRPDREDERASDYSIVPVPDPAALRVLLESALGVHAVVRKRRRLFLWRGVRVHLDDVTGLGRFLELEGVVADGRSEAEMRERVTTLRGELAIEPGDLVAGSYLDLIAAASPKRSYV